MSIYNLISVNFDEKSYDALVISSSPLRIDSNGNKARDVALSILPPQELLLDYSGLLPEGHHVCHEVPKWIYEPPFCLMKMTYPKYQRLTNSKK